MDRLLFFSSTELYHCFSFPDLKIITVAVLFLLVSVYLHWRQAGGWRTKDPYSFHCSSSAFFSLVMLDLAQPPDHEKLVPSSPLHKEPTYSWEPVEDLVYLCGRCWRVIPSNHCFHPSGTEVVRNMDGSQVTHLLEFIRGGLVLYLGILHSFYIMENAFRGVGKPQSGQEARS